MTTKLDDSGVMFADGTVMGSAKQLGMRNKLINGNFGINQRGVSGTVVLAAGAYGHDRFKAGASGCTYTFATSANVTTLTISAGSLQQVVEGLNLQSGTHVLSWSGTAQGSLDGGAYGASGAVTATAVGGTNMTVEFNTGTVSLAQLEEGSLASRFEQRLIGVELALCQRYAETLSYPISLPLLAVVYSNGLGAVGYAPFKVGKRVAPTVSFVPGSRFIFPSNIGGATGTLSGTSSVDGVGISTTNTIASASAGWIDTFSLFADSEL